MGETRVSELFADPAFTMTLFNALIVWPVARVFRRAGLNPWYALVVFVPLVGLMAAVAILGHSRWPALPDRAPARAPKARRRL